ncbi:MAG: 5-formyltetrahydrofolate cyclo-ligase [Buchnera aphidicola (Schlechtendalia peitan)]
MFYTRRAFIRQYFRNIRQKLTLEERKMSSVNISDIAFSCKKISSSKNIAIFMSFDGEIDTNILIKQFWEKNYSVFLPIVDPDYKKTLLFAKYFPSTLLQLNQFNILEPVITKKEDILFHSDMDVIIVPLVAFDKFGYRLGMGGGFYDKILINWKKEGFFPIGLAYNFQLMNKIIPASWEVPLPAVITPDKLWIWNMN